MHDIRYNEIRDEFYVANPFAQAILTFRGSADGQATPIRIIQGPKTMLNNSDTVGIDVVNDEILVSEEGYILVFPLAASGDVAPNRVIRGGPNMGWVSGAFTGVTVDPVHNVLVADGAIFESDGSRSEMRDSILIFDRTANGEVKPLRVIHGPSSGIKAIRQMQVYPKNGWIIITQITSGSIPEPENTFVGVWSIYDDGDVPPRWKIEGNPSNIMKKPRGVALNPKHKEVLVSDMRLNAVLTFSFPEIYDQEAKPPR